MTWRMLAIEWSGAISRGDAAYVAANEADHRLPRVTLFIFIHLAAQKR
jgi:hypothetical protein